MNNETKYPKLVIGSFLINDKNQIFLRTTPRQNNKYTCINDKVIWGNTIKETIKSGIKEKTNLNVTKIKLIDLSDGLNLNNVDGQNNVHLVFADHLVWVDNTNEFKMNENRDYKWLTVQEWLAQDKNIFGPYISPVLAKIKKMLNKVC